MSGSALIGWIVGSLLTFGWAVSVLVLLVRLVAGVEKLGAGPISTHLTNLAQERREDRKTKYPAIEKLSNPKPNEEDHGDALYKISRDSTGRIIADD